MSRRTIIRAGAITEDTLEDKDGDTKIQVEESTDEDKIRFDTAGSERVIIDETGNVGVGTSQPSDLLTLESDQPCIQFKESGQNRSKVFINDSDNLIIQQQQTNKHIVFKINDAGTVREGIRLNGMVPEIVVNEQSDSLIDFRVESNDNTHMLFVDGGNNRVGINTSSPTSTLGIGGSVSFNTTDIDAPNDPGTTYTCQDDDHVILVNTRPTAQNGIDSTLTITLPVSATVRGRVITVKDAGGYSDVNSITVQRQGSDTIDGINTSISIPNVAGWITLIADGGSNWYQIN